VHAELQDGGNLISTRDRLSLSEVREDETSGRDTLRSFCRPYVRNVELQLRIPRVASHRRDLSAPSARDAESAGRGGVFFFFLFFFPPETETPDPQSIRLYMHVYRPTPYSILDDFSLATVARECVRKM